MKRKEPMPERRIDINPVSEPRMTRADRWKQRDCVLAYRAYRDELRLKLPRYPLMSVLVIDFIIAMPQSWSQKKRAQMAGEPHQQKPDIDNLAKAFMDAFSEDDSYVYDLHARKFWGEKGAIILYEA